MLHGVHGHTRFVPSTSPQRRFDNPRLDGESKERQTQHFSHIRPALRLRVPAELCAQQIAEPLVVWPKEIGEPPPQRRTDRHIAAARDTVGPWWPFERGDTEKMADAVERHGHVGEHHLGLQNE